MTQGPQEPPSLITLQISDLQQIIESAFERRAEITPRTADAKVKEAVNYISNFEEAVVHAARQHGADGVVCGHIHHAIIADYEGIEYANCGDWVESCTALAEQEDGSLRLIHWLGESAELIDGVQADENRNRDRRVVTAN